MQQNVLQMEEQPVNLKTEIQVRNLQHCSNFRAELTVIEEALEKIPPDNNKVI